MVSIDDTILDFLCKYYILNNSIIFKNKIKKLTVSNGRIYHKISNVFYKGNIVDIISNALEVFLFYWIEYTP